MKKRWKPLTFLALLVAGGAFWALRPAKKAIAKVETARVQSMAVERTVSASGKIQPFTTVDVKSKAGGTVIKMAVEEGTRVKIGQLICLIDRRDNIEALQQARADVSAAQAALSSAQASAQLQNETLGPQIRQAQESVISGRARLQSARSALSQSRETLVAQIRESQAGVDAARVRLASARAEAASQPSIVESAVKSSAASVAAAQAQLDSARQSLQILTVSTLPQQEASAKAAISQSKSNLEVAKRNFARQKTLFDKGFVAQNTLESAQNQLDLAQSALETAQVRLDTLRADFDSQRADARARIAQAQANLAGARANLGQSQANRVQIGLKNREVQTALANLRQSEASLRATLARRAQVQQREADLRAQSSALRSDEAALQSARANVLQNQVRAADVTSAGANLQKARAQAQTRSRNLDQTTVLSPSDGVVLQKYVDEGAIVQAGDSGFSGGTSIVQLANVNRVYVAAQVDESDIAEIRAGQSVRVLLDAYPDQNFVGKVRKIFPQAQLENNVTTIKVQVEIQGADRRLRPNLNATCDFQLSNQTALSLPLEAVRDEGQKSFVTLIKDPKKAFGDPKNQLKREVKVGTRGDARVGIQSGLKAGEIVVLPVEATPAPPGGGGGPFG